MCQQAYTYMLMHTKEMDQTCDDLATGLSVGIGQKRGVLDESNIT